MIRHNTPAQGLYSPVYAETATLSAMGHPHMGHPHSSNHPI